MINRMLSRALSLLLAVTFLFGAGLLSFYLLFEGTRIYADSGMSVTLTEIKQNGRAVNRLSSGMSNLSLTFSVRGATRNPTNNLDIEFSRGGAMSSGSSTPTISNLTTESGRYVYDVTLSDCTFSGGSDSASITLYRNESATYTVSLSAWLENGDGTYSLQSYVFYDRSGDQITRMRKGATISKLVFTIKEAGISLQNYNNANKSAFSATLNYANFSKTSKDEPVFSPTAMALPDGSISYTLTFYDLRYTGKTDQLELKIGYPSSFGLERRQFIEKLTEGEIYISSSGESSSGSSADAAPPTPKLIISSYNYGGGSPTAASSVMLDVTFTNTSQRVPIENIVMSVKMPEKFVITNSSNTFYIPNLAAGESETQSVGFTIKPDSEPISHAIEISFTGEYVVKNERKALEASTQSISIPVSQLNRVTLSPVEVPMELYIEQGNEQTFEVAFVNMGKASIYNVTVTLVGENISQAGIPEFIGNIESGKKGSVDMTISPIAAGPVAGEVVLAYEDANMNISELRTPFQAQAIEMEPQPMPDFDPGEGDLPVIADVWYKKIPVWGWISGVVVLIIGGAFTAKVIRSVRQKKLEAEDEDF